jgi:hypothetical protein
VCIRCFTFPNLKKAIGDYAAEPQLPTEFELDIDSVEEPEEILASREDTKAVNVRTQPLLIETTLLLVIQISPWCIISPMGQRNREFILEGAKESREDNSVRM